MTTASARQRRAALSADSARASETVPLVLPPLPDIDAALQALVNVLPSGRVTSFGRLATALGDVKAARWVAVTCGERRKAGDLDRGIPWHRVVRQSGELTGDADSGCHQRALLQSEGCLFDAAGRVASESFCAPAAGSAPLRQLADWQSSAAQLGRWDVARSIPPIVGGVDLSYINPRKAVAAYVAIEVATGKVVYERVHRAPARFPYIPGYLTFRELPPLLELLAIVQREASLAEVVLVDGTGRLHPRQFGIAVSVGLLGSCTTIGVAKHQLCGKLAPTLGENGDVPVVLGDEPVGLAMRQASRRDPLYVSPGHGIDLTSAAAIVRAVWTSGRLPLPTAHADALSRSVARKIQRGGDP